jgi:hypothetical protein
VHPKDFVSSMGRTLSVKSRQSISNAIGIHCIRSMALVSLALKRRIEDRFLTYFCINQQSLHLFGALGKEPHDGPYSRHVGSYGRVHLTYLHAPGTRLNPLPTVRAPTLDLTGEDSTRRAFVIRLRLAAACYPLYTPTLMHEGQVGRNPGVTDKRKALEACQRPSLSVPRIRLQEREQRHVPGFCHCQVQLNQPLLPPTSRLSAPAHAGSICVCGKSPPHMSTCHGTSQRFCRASIRLNGDAGTARLASIPARGFRGSDSQVEESFRVV